MRGMQWATVGLIALGLLAMIIHFRLAWRRFQFVNLQETYRIATEGGKDGLATGQVFILALGSS